MEEHLQDFCRWLEKEHYKESTISQLKNYTGAFLLWLSGENTGTEAAIYNDLVLYIKHLRKTDGTRLINRKLGAIRKYYEYLKTTGTVQTNIATGLHVKGARKEVLHDLPEKSTLEALYNSYRATNLRTQRNKVILGLLIYQGLTTGELHRLEKIHLRLREGKIDVPGTRSSNGRTLALEARQIIELQEYITQTRPQIIKNLKGEKEHNPKTGHQLFISEQGSVNIKPVLLHLFRELRKEYPQIRNATRIRQGVIAYWLKTRGLREVQYMAGHRHVSSTERYRTDDLEALGAALKKHHPLSEE